MILLITGATGFVGRNFLLRALKEGIYEKIMVPVRSREKLAAQFLGDGFDAIPPQVVPLVTSGPEWAAESWPDADHVVHCAGVLWGETKNDFFGMNVSGTVNLLRRIPKPEKLVILSSQAAAGPCAPGELCKGEGRGDRPLTWYGQSKLEMEKTLAREFPDLNYVVLRPPMILGARDSATLPLFKMVRQPVRFKPGFGVKEYSYIAVTDLVNAIMACFITPDGWVTLKQRVFYVAADKPVTDRELISSAAEALQRRGFTLPVPHGVVKGLSMIVDRVPSWRKALPTLSAERVREVMPNRWVVSSRAFQEQFRWRPASDLRTTIKETCDWYVRTGQLTA